GSCRRGRDGAGTGPARPGRPRPRAADARDADAAARRRRRGVAPAGRRGHRLAARLRALGGRPRERPPAAPPGAGGGRGRRRGGGWRGREVLAARAEERRRERAAAVQVVLAALPAGTRGAALRVEPMGAVSVSVPTGVPTGLRFPGRCRATVVDDDVLELRA